MSAVTVPVLWYGGSTHAQSAMDTTCGLVVSTPTADNTSVHTAAKVICSTHMDHTVKVGDRIRKAGILGSWPTPADWTYKYNAGITTLTITRSYNRNGAGTQKWRGQGLGETTDGGSETANSSSKSLTC